MFSPVMNSASGPSCHASVAHTLSSDLTGPPVSASWLLSCGSESYQSAVLSVHDVSQALQVSGMCSENSELNGVYHFAGSINGATHYEQPGAGNRIHYNRDCDDLGGARWVIAPNANSDLAGTGCSNGAYSLSSDASGPPQFATWAVLCGSSWESLVISISTLVEMDNEQPEDADDGFGMLEWALIPVLLFLIFIGILCICLCLRSRSRTICWMPLMPVKGVECNNDPRTAKAKEASHSGMGQPSHFGVGHLAPASIGQSGTEV